MSGAPEGGPYLRVCRGTPIAPLLHHRASRDGPRSTEVEVPPAEPERHVHQGDQHRHLDQRPDHRRERRAAADPERRHRHRDRQLEVVGRRRERERGRLPVCRAGAHAHPERDQEHHHEVDQQRDRDPHDVERQGHDVLALEREHHHDREQQRDQRDRADPRDERALVPRSPLGPDQREARDDPGEERDAQVDEHALGDLADRDVDGDPLEPDPGRQDRDEHVREHRVEQHLEDRVERDERGAVLGVAAGQVVPHDDHRDAAREADHDQPHHVLRLVAQEDRPPGRTSAAVR